MNANEQPPEVDEVARLIRLGGMRADAPPDVAARAKTVVQAAWRDKVRRRMRRRFLWAGAGLAAAASLILAVGIGLRSGGWGEALPVARVQALVGQAWQTPADPTGDPIPLRIGDTVLPEGEIVTASGGRVGLIADGGYSIRLDEGTRIAMTSSRQIDLAQGALYFDSGSESVVDLGFEVRTSHGIARPVGTQFEVRVADPAVRVRVRRGTVELTGAGGVRSIAAGNEIEVDAQGVTASRTMAAFGADWAWIEDVRPELEIDGLPLRAVLDWACREQGWQLRFADEAIERQASEISLTGNISGLTVEETLDAFLQTSSMTYRLDRGELTILPAP